MINPNRIMNKARSLLCISVERPGAIERRWDIKLSFKKRTSNKTLGHFNLINKLLGNKVLVSLIRTKKNF